MQESVFAQYEPKGYPYKFAGRIQIELLAGGTPTNPEVAEAWIRAKGYGTPDLKDAAIRGEVARIMDERGVDENAAVDEVAKNRHLSGFKRVPTDAEVAANPRRASDSGYPDHAGELYIEGRQLKACIKEAASVAADAGKLKQRGLGEMNSRKGIISFMAEHVFVVEQRLYLGVYEPTDVIQSFVHTFRGSGIQYTEIVENAEFDFTVETDRKFSDEEWAMLWLTGQRQGVGATRSQGYGRFSVIAWNAIAQERPTSLSAKRKAA